YTGDRVTYPAIYSNPNGEADLHWAGIPDRQYHRFSTSAPYGFFPVHRFVLSQPPCDNYLRHGSEYPVEKWYCTFFGLPTWPVLPLPNSSRVFLRTHLFLSRRH